MHVLCACLGGGGEGQGTRGGGHSGQGHHDSHGYGDHPDPKRDVGQPLWPLYGIKVAWKYTLGGCNAVGVVMVGLPGAYCMAFKAERAALSGVTTGWSYQQPWASHQHWMLPLAVWSVTG